MFKLYYMSTIKTIILLLSIITIIIACKKSINHQKIDEKLMVNSNAPSDIKAVSQVNGLNMYYEIHGQGKPLVLIHGGGSTIETSFGRIIPLLSPSWQLICVDLQVHGRTEDRSTPISFKQDADDVAQLVRNLGYEKVDVFGFSNGANTALQMAIRHPELCSKIIAGSPLLKKDGTFPQFWEFMKNGTFEQMPQAYKDAFLAVNPDVEKMQNMYQKCADRMINFEEFSDEEIKAIQVPVLLINGENDVATTAHVSAMSKLIADCQLEIVNGGHGAYLGEITTFIPEGQTQSFEILPVIEKFLNK